MSVIGFVPNPEMAPALIAWAHTLADKDEETTFLCLETGFDGRTTQAVREALGEKGASVGRQTVCNLLSVSLPRFTFSRISLADLVQM